MEKRQLGKTDMQVSVLGFGGAEIGYEGATTETVQTLLNSALDAGLNVIDTAECYETSEELIGQTVSHRRDEFYLFTKVGHPRGVGSEDWSAASVLESIERSLRRMKTDRVDLVQLHSCSESVLRKGEAITALQTARERGYTRYIGYSGDSRAAKFAVECDVFDTLQTSLNIAEQEPIELTLPIARETVGFVGRLLHQSNSRPRRPLYTPIIADIAEDEIATLLPPHWSLRGATLPAETPG